MCRQANLATVSSHTHHHYRIRFLFGAPALRDSVSLVVFLAQRHIHPDWQAELHWLSPPHTPTTSAAVSTEGRLHVACALGRVSLLPRAQGFPPKVKVKPQLHELSHHTCLHDAHQTCMKERAFGLPFAVFIFVCVDWLESLRVHFQQHFF